MSTRGLHPSLLGLPPELRQVVYQHLFHSASLTFVLDPDTAVGHERALFKIVLPVEAVVLLTCRTCYREALPHVHGINSFILQGRDCFRRFTSICHATRKQRITHLYDVNTPQLQLWTLIDQFPQLQSLVLRCERFVYIGCSCSPWRGVTHPVTWKDFRNATSDHLTTVLTDNVPIPPLSQLRRNGRLESIRARAFVRLVGYGYGFGMADRFSVPCTFDLVERTVVDDPDRVVDCDDDDEKEFVPPPWLSITKRTNRQLSMKDFVHLRHVYKNYLT